MARFAFSVTIKIQVEANTVQEAFGKFVQWRRFIKSAMQGRLLDAGVIRYSIPPVHEFTEVDSAWQEVTTQPVVLGRLDFLPERFVKHLRPESLAFGAWKYSLEYGRISRPRPHYGNSPRLSAAL